MRKPHGLPTPQRNGRLPGITAAMLIAGLGASGAHAADGEGWYVAAGYGGAAQEQARRELNDALSEQFSNSPLTLNDTSVSKHNTTWSAGVGYWFAQDFAAEAAYLHVGGVHYHAAGSADVSGTAEASNLDLYAHSHGVTLAVVWTAPLWNAIGAELRAGAFIGKTDTQFLSTVGEDRSSDSLSVKTTTPLLGAGASYAATSHVVLKLEYAHLFGIKEAGFDKKFAADTVTLGLSYVF
jgi:opacity protein-like surface antigen